ncbi:MAG: hypothetical protein DMG10_27990 [Acidobacteria bacterium]|nr:MAG: hypothetical protein DMG10_27990 [Acidobacteriota bacterium]
MTNDKWQMNNDEARTTNCHLSFFIGHWSFVIFFAFSASLRRDRFWSRLGRPVYSVVKEDV